MRYSAPLGLFFAALTLPAFAIAQEAEDEPDSDVEKEVRTLRKELSKLEEQYDKLLSRCRGDNHNRADARACDNARVTYQDVQQLKKKIAVLLND